MSEKPAQRILDQIAESQRSVLEDLFTNQRRTIAECTLIMRSTIPLLLKSGWRTHERVWNAGLFLNVAAHDVSILLEDLLYERDEWRRRFHARSLALSLYEIAEDFPSVFGKEFSRALGALGTPEELKLELRAAQKAISSFWDTHRNFLKNIRTVAGAHRDHDALLMLDVIEQIDFMELLTLGQKLGTSLNNVGSKMQAVLTFTSNIRPPELADPLT